MKTIEISSGVDAIGQTLSEGDAVIVFSRGGGYENVTLARVVKIGKVLIEYETVRGVVMKIGPTGMIKLSEEQIASAMERFGEFDGFVDDDD